MTKLVSMIIVCSVVFVTVPLMAEDTVTEKDVGGTIFKEGKKETHSEKKLLAYGVDWPAIEYTKNHIGAMEKSPFDGVVLRSIYHLFSKKKMPAETMKTAIRDLKATPFNRFTDNFLNLRTIPVYANDKTDKGYHGDWFDGEWWDVILHNAKASATVAREGGLKGIMFDPEAYHGNPWKYGVQKYRATKSFEEYTAKVRERGREMIKAINSVYPEITFITIFSTSWTAWEMAEKNISIEESTSGLMPCFIDGIIEAATPQTTIIDGFELAYTFTEYQQFVDAADLIVHGSAHLSTIPDEYKKTMKVGFGLSQGHVTPQELGSNIRCAYTLADGYVWLWSDHATNWWEGRVVQAYADAVINNKRPLTKSEIAEITRQTAEFNELRKRIRPPEVAVIYSTYRNGAGGWHNEAFRALGWKANKWKNVDLNGLMAKLDDYDMVFTEPNYNMKDIHDFRQYRAKWLSFLENGGIVVVIEVQANPQQLDWVVELGPDFDLTVQTFSEFQQGSSWENPASELDFGFVKPTWAHFSHWAPQWVVSNHNVHEKPIILYQKVGNGLFVVSTTYPPSFPTAKHLKTIWYLWKIQSIGEAP
jgi:hypothetical protein